MSSDATLDFQITHGKAESSPHSMDRLFIMVYRAREALRQCLPEPLRDTTFHAVLKDDAATRRCLGQLLMNLSDNGMN